MEKFINIYELNGDAMFRICLEEFPNKVNLEKYNQMIEQREKELSSNPSLVHLKYKSVDKDLEEEVKVQD